MRFINKINLSVSVLTILNLSSAMANEGQNVQDMSDPLAVYTQAGGGVTDKGLNFKFGQTYDTGSATTMGMNIAEIKGIGGKSFGIRDRSESLYRTVDNGIDTIRYRNFEVDTTSGRGTQIDINMSFDARIADASYSFIQALPSWKFAQFYPLAGVGVTLENDIDEGITIPGTFAALGFYSKYTITDRIWVNYNPLWVTSMIGSDEYENHHFANQSNVLTHEVAISYQITPRTNVRYFANWNEVVNFDKGDHRIELNYQF